MERWTKTEIATHRACMGRASSTLALLLDASASMDARNNLGRTPLIVAAESGATQCSTLLLARCGDALGEQLEKVDNDGNTAAHLASNRGHSPALTLLLDAGSSMTGHNPAGTTPLIAAASKGADCVTLLLTRSGDVIAEHLAMVDNRGNSAVHWACTENHPATLALLLDTGASMDARGNIGRTLLMMAAEYGAMDSLTLLMERYGATLTEHLAMADNEGNSAVHLASIFKKPSTLALLLDASPSMDARNNRGRTPLIAAVVNGAAECVMLLLSRGGNALDLDAKQPAGGWTALHLAAHYGYQAIVSLLMHAGADPTIRNIWNATPVAVAQDKGHPDCVPHLEAAIAEPQRSCALFKARALIDARIDIPKARRQPRQDGLSLEAQHAAALAAAPVYFKQRMPRGACCRMWQSRYATNSCVGTSNTCWVWRAGAVW